MEDLDQWAEPKEAFMWPQPWDEEDWTPEACSGSTGERFWERTDSGDKAPNRAVDVGNTLPC